MFKFSVCDIGLYQKYASLFKPRDLNLIQFSLSKQNIALTEMSEEFHGNLIK